MQNDPLARRRANTINDLRSLAEEIRRSQRDHDQQQLQRISESASVVNGNGGASSPEFEQMSQEKALIIQVGNLKLIVVRKILLVNVKRGLIYLILIKLC